VIGLFGGAFDPPHNGHVALLEAARHAFALDECVVAVTAAPPHKQLETPSVVRLELAKAAFPDDTILLDAHGRTIDLLRVHPEWEGAWFLIGADEFADFPNWKEPDEVLELVRLGVATRPGYPSDRLEQALGKLRRKDRVDLFDMEPVEIASRDLRARLDRGEDVHELVPDAVWALIERGGLYGRSYTDPA
jgi:nicotinate-nucleotide adenylyltransferase